MATLSCCGILFTKFSAIEPTDPEGCVLAMAHDGPHEFKDDRGQDWLWETDWECTCAECMSGDGDLCSIYWRKRKRRTVAT